MSLWFRSTFSGLHSYAPGISQFAICGSRLPRPLLAFKTSDYPANGLLDKRRPDYPTTQRPAPYRTVGSQSHKMCYDLSGRIPPAIWPGLPV